MRNGQQLYAAKSVNDYTLENSNPYPYWEKVFAVSDFPGTIDDSYPVPQTVTATKKIYTYDNNGYQESNRWIDEGDVCTVNGVYSSGYINVTYPTSDGSRTAYAKTEDFNLSKDYAPEGYLDVTTGGLGTVRFVGWALDRDTPDKPVNLHVYMDGPAGQGTCVSTDHFANLARSDLGGNYGFDFTIPLNVSGEHTFYIHAIDTSGNGNNTCLTNVQNTTSIAEEVDLGDDFKAVIFSSKCWKPIGQSDTGNVELMTQKRENNKRILWHFIKESDGTYSIWSYQTGTPICSTDTKNVYCAKDCKSRFKIYKNDVDYYIKSVDTNTVFDLTNYNTNDGANIGFNADIHSEPAEKFSVCLLNATKNSLDYEISADKTSTEINSQVTVTIDGKVDYVYEYIYFIKSPDGKTTSVNNGINYTYTFTPTQAGTYIVYAQIKNPVTSEKGSETATNKFVKIDVTDSSVTTPDKEELKGDANGDGEVNIADAVVLQKWLLGESNELIYWENVDLCKDGKIDVFDLCLLKGLLINK